MRWASVIAMALVACSPTTRQAPTAGPPGRLSPCNPAGSSVTLVAQSFSFDRDCIGTTTGTPLRIRFENRDFGVRHNLVILPAPWGYNTPPAALFFGPISTGPTDERYETVRLPAGLLTFLCFVHHDEMVGDVGVAPVVRRVARNIDVSWGHAPPGFVFDVQVAAPGSGRFLPWLVATTMTDARYTPAGSGEYFFRVALYRARFGIYGYSPPAGVTIA